MLDALLATIGILGLLATIAIKFGKACSDAVARHTERQEQAHEAGPEPVPGRACPHRRRRKRQA